MIIYLQNFISFLKVQTQIEFEITKQFQSNPKYVNVIYKLYLYQNIIFHLLYTHKKVFRSPNQLISPTFTNLLMDTSRFDRITDLTSNRTNWKIKVRLTRLWKSINTSTDTFKGYNMILLDDDVSPFT